MIPARGFRSCGRRRQASALTAIVLAACLPAGCAHGGAGGLRAHLVRPGDPQVEIPAPEALLPLELSRAQQAEVDRAIAERGRTPRVELPTLETTDLGLKEALARVAAVPDARHLRLLAAEYRRLRILDKAIDALTAALKDAPDAAAYAERAQVWRDWGWPQFGLGDAYRAAHLAPESPMALNTLGTLLQAVGAGAAARTAYRAALAADPRAAYVLNNLCYLSLRHAEYEQASRECRSALDANPGLTAARHNLAMAYAAASHEDAAQAGAARTLPAIGRDP